MDVQLDKDKRVESENTKAQEETVREDVEKFDEYIERQYSI